VSGVVRLLEGLGGAVDNPTHPPDPVGYAPPPGDPAPNGEGQARPDLEGAA
jgi:hypothetical protein